ncbi:GyrI-like domain-containing protein [Corynebacterium crudilactis]|uniref:Transcriptional regulator n=1 Tax=Corynebacterium crudilactis TaxID=1652495 RepID=A0A172QTJ5_9CORY|nr:GyrI-like domain-containing protein [Corynebacterium crudilactis]ANE03968.1 transcriptional regulator [Corynebacterium crudilactis]
MYLMKPPVSELEILEVDDIATVVAVFDNHPMSEMASAFDSTYQVLFPTLAAQGIHPIGPGYALYTSVPSDTVSLEVGIPVDQPLDGDITADNGIVLKNSTIPGGKIARISHLGSFDGLGQAWGTFMESVAQAGHSADMPFWEVYVTEPSPDMDPATLQTDLYTKLK